MNKKMVTRVLILLIAIVLLTLFFSFDLHQKMTLEGLKSGLAQLHAWRDAAPLQMALGYFLIYVVATALSLPGALVLTLAGGAIFGFVQGFVLVSFASTIGATLAFLAARYVLRDWVQQRFGEKLKPMNDGIEKEGAFYLFTLRLVPVFPFFLINLLMGLTKMRTLTYYWVSQLGMLAGTVIYVNAGTQLAAIDSLKGIVSPAIVLSLAALGLFPLITKKILDIFKKNKIYSKWNHLKPKKFDRNVVVIGAGAAGLVTSYIAAAVKAKVTLVEAHKMGGDCLNYGCVPSKALIKSAKLAQQIRQADHYGLTASQPEFSFRQVMARVNEVVKKIEPHDSVERYTELGVEVLQGYGRVLNPWTVEIKDEHGVTQTLTTRSIVIAAGAQPFVPALPGLDEVGYVTSDTLWEKFSAFDAPPKRLVVLGGGPIGCELTQSFARLGVQVTQIEMSGRLLSREDAEVSEILTESMRSDGVTILTEHKALRCERKEVNGLTVKSIVVEHEGVERHIEFDELLCAVGRVARLQGYGLEELGIPTQRTVVTNEYLETLYPNIYAAGDVAGPYQFTHTAAHQAWYASVNALFGQFKRFKVDYSVIPAATFTSPEIARVGLNEQEAVQKGIAFEVTRYGIDDLDRAIADSTDHGFVKVLTVPGKDKILGVTIVGEHAGDLLAEFVLAMKHGLGLNKILGTIHTYPTLAEANKYVAGEWRRAHTNPAVMKWLARYHAWRRG
ncbi:FAD-dependent oxidoreductase [Zwartia sp.]|uniref:FAD-dependent oxidoreductase n=1 Tax=Zwartia sp. TaxID=2978004 RepID=UPI003BAE2119